MPNYSVFHYHLRTFSPNGGAPWTDELFAGFQFTKAEAEGRKLLGKLLVAKVRVQKCYGQCYMRAHQREVVSDGQPLEIVFRDK